MERIKMSRLNRAKQFAPFDALKGLSEALSLVEYQHEMVLKGEIQEEKAEEISKILLNLEKDNLCEISYYFDKHIKTIKGKVKLEIDKYSIKVELENTNINNKFNKAKCVEILLNDIVDIIILDGV